MSTPNSQTMSVEDHRVQIKPMALLTEAWNLFRPKWTKVLSVLVVAFIIQLIGEESLELVARSAGEQSGTYLLFGLIFSLVQIYISAGLVFTVLKIVRGQEFGWTDLFSQAEKFFKYLVATIAVTLVIIAGLVLLIIPGIYFSLKFWPVMYLIVDRPQLKLKEAFKLAGQMTKGIKWQILWVQLVIGVLNLGGALLFGLGLLITVPVSTLAGAILYDKLLVRTDQVKE